jgi:hypothetical protein
MYVNPPPSKIKEQINMMARYEDPPNITIIHIGGYDMGHIRLGYLQLMLGRMFDPCQHIVV